MSYVVYIYYRVPVSAAAELRRRIVAVQASLAQSTESVGRLLSKADEPLLWMEVYEGIVDRLAFAAALEQAMAAQRVADLIPAATRKTEIFADHLVP